ncbi:hypothetical protein AB1Y20_020541 [Prymnesium parvum]|uniref:Uncharacterized protein n=1 Tax=Prymnesium parvum TaxID=97485 RepID=A0AB34JXW8_PRYPA
MCEAGTSAREALFVVGPERVSGRWVFLCPSCDDDRLDKVQYDGKTIFCFKDDPFEGEDVANKRRRFFLYSAIAKELGGTGRRVDLPLCVKDKIQDLYGESEVGFKDTSYASRS